MPFSKAGAEESDDAGGGEPPSQLGRAIHELDLQPQARAATSIMGAIRLRWTETFL
jgi:hypothetical protein